MVMRKNRLSPQQSDLLVGLSHLLLCASQLRLQKREREEGEGGREGRRREEREIEERKGERKGVERGKNISRYTYMYNRYISHPVKCTLCALNSEWAGPIL